jgi:hypothetical protein
MDGWMDGPASSLHLLLLNVEEELTNGLARASSLKGGAHILPPPRLAACCLLLLRSPGPVSYYVPAGLAAALCRAAEHHVSSASVRRGGDAWHAPQADSLFGWAATGWAGPAAGNQPFGPLVRWSAGPEYIINPAGCPSPSPPPARDSPPSPPHLPAALPRPSQPAHSPRRTFPTLAAALTPTLAAALSPSLPVALSPRF